MIIVPFPLLLLREPHSWTEAEEKPESEGVGFREGGVWENMERHLLTHCIPQWLPSVQSFIHSTNIY